MRAEIEVFGATETARHWDQIAERSAAPLDFLRAAGRTLLRTTAARFDRQPWKPLRPGTIRQKARKGQSPQILRATGRLERALTVWGAPGQKMDLEGDELVFGLIPNGKAYYGNFHQRGKGHFPKRKILAVNKDTRDRLQVAAREFLLGRSV